MADPISNVGMLRGSTPVAVNTATVLYRVLLVIEIATTVVILSDTRRG